MLLSFVMGLNCVYGGEVDQFTDREHFVDVTKKINSSVNDKIFSITDSLNSENGQNEKCDKERLYNTMEDVLDTEPASIIEKEIYNSKTFIGQIFSREKRVMAIPFEKSIYANITSEINFFTARGYSCCSAIVKIGNSLVGTDKISHFFTHGKLYFDRYVKAKQGLGTTDIEAEKKAIDLALLVGEEKEEGEWGKWSTGISSYGDRAANFGGFVFWRDVIDSGNPIIKCKNGKWEIARKFNFSDYVTDGWDEAINCSSYQDAKFAKVVDDALAVLSINSGNKISCPINKESCLVLKAIYGVYAEKILHPKCYAVEAGIILDIEKQKLSSGLEGGGDSPMINESKRDNKGFRNDIEKSNGSSQEIFWK